MEGHLCEAKTKGVPVRLANWFARDVIHKLRLSRAGFKHLPRVPWKKRTDGSTKFVNGFVEAILSNKVVARAVVVADMTHTKHKVCAR